MFRRVLLLAVLSASTLSASGWWSPYVQFEGRAGYDYRQGGMAYGFAPLKQNNRSILFAQAQGGRMRHQTTAGLGGGYRRLINRDGFWGAALFGDWNRSDTGNHFWQIVASGELVLNCAEFRGNFYLPQRNGRQLERTSTVGTVIEGTSIFDRFLVSDQNEHAYSGFDLEAGLNREIGCCGRIRGYAAYYQYAQDQRKDIYGPRLRLRYELDNIKWAGTRLIVQGLWQYDRVRGSQKEVMAGLRFSPCKPKCPCLPPILRRMNDLVQRDIGIIYVKRENLVEEIDINIGNIYFFAENAAGSGTQSDPTDIYQAVMEGEPGDILFGLNTLGTIQLDQGPIALQEGLQLYSFGTQETVEITLSNGAILPITDLTGQGRANVQQLNPAQPVVTTADNTTVSGLKLTDGLIGLQIDLANNVLVDTVEIDPPSFAGIQLNGATNIQILNTIIDVEDAMALDVNGGGNIAIANLQATTTTGPLVSIDGLTASLTMSGSTLASMTGQGLNIHNGIGAVTVTTSSLTHAGNSVTINSTQAPINLSGLQIANNGTTNSTLIDVIGAQSPVTFGQVNLLNYNNLGQSAISLLSNTGSVSFAQTTIMGTGGTALFGTNNDQINIAAGVINAQDAPAMHLANCSTDILLTLLDSSGSATSAAILDEVSGSLTVSGAASLVQARTGLDVRNNSTLDITLGALDANPIEDYGISWSDSSGSLHVTGMTSIGGLQANIAEPAGIFCQNSTLDFTFDDVTIDGSGTVFSSALLVDDCSGPLHLRDLMTSNTSDSISVRNNASCDITLNSFTATPVAYTGVRWNASAGSLTVNGPTTMNGFLNVNYPTGFTIYNSTLDHTFGNIALDMNNNNDATAFDMNGNTGTFSAGDVTIENTEWGLWVNDPGALTFNDLTVTPSCRYGIEWYGGAGSLTAQDVTIDQASDFGIEVNSNATPTLTFANLTLNQPSVGVAYDQAGGSLNVTGATQVSSSLADSISALSATNAMFDFGDLTITTPIGQGIDWSGGTGSFTAGTTLIDDPLNEGINILNADVSFSFGALTINSPTTGILWDTSTGSFDVTNATLIDQPSERGIYVFNSTMPNFTYGDLAINDAAGAETIYFHQTVGGNLTAADVSITSTNDYALEIIQSPNTEVSVANFTSTGAEAVHVEFFQSSGSFSATGAVTLNGEGTGIGVGSSSGPVDFTLVDLHFDSNGDERTGVEFSSSSGSILATGTTTMEDAESALRCTNSDVNVTFGDFLIDQTSDVGILWQNTTGSFTANGTTSLTNIGGGGISITNNPGPVEFTFADLTVSDSQFRSLEIFNTVGSLTATGTTNFIRPGLDGGGSELNSIWVDKVGANPSSPQISFNELIIDDVPDVGIKWTDSDGSFAADTVTLTQIGLKGIQIQDTSASVSLGTLNIDGASRGEVNLLNCTGPFSITNGGLIQNLIFDAITATNCTGAIEIGGTAISPLEMRNLIQTAIHTTDCDSLTVNHCNIHEIGIGSGNVEGVFATDTQSSVTVAHSLFTSIGNGGCAIKIANSDKDSSPLTVVIEDNDFQRGLVPGDYETDTGLDINFSSSMANGQSIDCTISENTFFDLDEGLICRLAGYSGTDSTRNTVSIDHNTFDGTDLSVFRTVSLHDIQLQDYSETLLEIDQNQAIRPNPVLFVNIAQILPVNFDGTADIFVTNNTYEIFQDNIASGTGNGNIRARYDLNSWTGLISATAADSINLAVTYTNCSGTKIAVSSEDASVVDCLFGDPAGTTTMGNQFGIADANPDYFVSRVVGSLFRLGGLVGPSAELAIISLGNTNLGGGPPTVQQIGPIPIVAPGAIPQPTP